MFKTGSFALCNRCLSETGRHVAVAFALAVLMLTSFAAAQTLTGTVNDSTTGKPSGGDEVIVFSLGRDVKQSGRTNTDPRGRFSVKLDNARTRHLVRAIHQGFAYHRIVPAGTTSVAIDVYDVAKKVNGIGLVADIMRIQAANGQITVTRAFGVRNTSNPPRIQMNERNLEFYIPDGGHIVENSGTAIIENGPPMKFAPVAEGEKNRYSFVSPLRPGLTRFEVTYQLPYSGSLELDPKSIYPLEHFMVILPKSMQFKGANNSTGFKAFNLPSVPDAIVQVASNTTDWKNLAFNISGEGILQIGQQGEGSQSSNEPKERSANVASPARSTKLPSGGLIPPVDASSLLRAYRWWILGGFAAPLIIAGVFVAWRQQAAIRAFRRQRRGSSLESHMPHEEAHYFLAEKGIPQATRAPVAAPTTSQLMGQIKEQLFNLEVERKNGKISQAEFEKAWIDLDQMLEGVLKGEAQNVQV